MIKARLATHGNKDSEIDGLKTDSTTCPPTGIRTLLSISNVNKWKLEKTDFKYEFIQTIDANNGV